VIESSITSVEQATRRGREVAPDAWLVLDRAFARGLTGIAAGDELLVVTWLHRASRTVLEVHPRATPGNAITGVFATRSPHRPNPLGLHRVIVRERAGDRLLIGPIEAIDGTPVVDIRAVVGDTDD
jgi:tRNA-Thr(GGU) m(6)t(6)A37 methyltransferase TsaA